MRFESVLAARYPWLSPAMGCNSGLSLWEASEFIRERREGLRGRTVQSLPVVHLLGEGVGGAVVVHLDEVWEEVVDCLCEENWGEGGTRRGGWLRNRSKGGRRRRRDAERVGAIQSREEAREREERRVKARRAQSTNTLSAVTRPRQTTVRLQGSSIRQGSVADLRR